MSEQADVSREVEERTRAQAEYIADREKRNVQEVQEELLAVERAGGTREERRAERDAVTGGEEAIEAVEESERGKLELAEQAARARPAGGPDEVAQPTASSPDQPANTAAEDRADRVAQAQRQAADAKAKAAQEKAAAEAQAKEKAK